MENNRIGFIILRHVIDEKTNKFWILSYSSIRKHYPENHILIIDDNSDFKYLTNEVLYKTTIIYSEYHKRGELLPYYYYLKIKLFEVAVIIHDSVFINKELDLNVDKYKFIWHFTHVWDQIEDETKMIKLFNDDELLKFYEDKSSWQGCFGGMSIITHEYLTYINSKYDLSILLDHVISRYNRCSFERIIGCLLQKEHSSQSLLGDIHNYHGDLWETIYEERHKFDDAPIAKVWANR
jgi:hypothetical protein